MGKAHADLLILPPCDNDGFTRNFFSKIINQGTDKCILILRATLFGVIAQIMVKARGGTPLYLLYRDVPLDRVRFSGIPVLNRVYNSRVCVLNRVFIPLTSRRVLLSRVA